MLFLIVSIVLITLINANERNLNTRRVNDWVLVEDSVQRKPFDMPVLLALSHSAESKAKLTKEVYAVSDPRSSRYGKHLSVSDITDIVAPSAAALESVRQWLQARGATHMSLVKNKDVITCRLPIRTIEKEFKVMVKLWKNERTGVFKLKSAVHPTIPNELKKLVDIVHGISEMSPQTRRQSNSLKAATPAAVEKGSSEPVVTVVLGRGGNATFAVNVRPRCADGSFATKLPACGSGLKAMEVSWLGQQQPEKRKVTCHLAADGNATEPDVECMAAGFPTQYWKPMRQLTVRVQYGDGSWSDAAVNPFPVVASPIVLPQTIRAHYGIDPNSQVVNPAATQSIVEFEQQYYSPTDLQLFFKAVGLAPELASSVTTIGPNFENKPGVEASLDIDYIMAIAPGSPTTFWSIKAESSVEIDDILKWCYAVMNRTEVPLTYSISYGMAEAEVDNFLGPGYLARFDVEIQKLAARGLTVIIACGDTGAGDLGPPPMSLTTCEKHLNPDWPSQSPWITAVGSTQFTPYATPICNYPAGKGGVDCDHEPVGEASVSLDNGLFWTTGGGFSNVESRPAFQEAAVSSYLASAKKNGLLPPTSFFNENGRSYPDLVTVGHNLVVVANGTFMPVDGTSASAPVWGGIVTLLNDRLISAGLSPLGWANPFLYQAAVEMPEVFYDVTVGQNKCGAYPAKGFPQAEECCPYGFSAQPGFDAASGLGSPVFPNLLAAAFAAANGDWRIN